MKRARVEISGQCVPVELPVELVLRVAQHFAALAPAEDLRKARLVCRDWHTIVTQYADPFKWCQRLWGTQERTGSPLMWPRDEQFLLCLPPVFQELVQQCTVHHFTWSQLAPLAGRLIEKKDVGEVKERRLWESICLYYPEQATADVVASVLKRETPRSVSSYGLTTLLQSRQFRDVLLHQLKWEWHSGCDDPAETASLLLHSGVWCTMLGMPPLERPGTGGGQRDTVMQLVWAQFVDTDCLSDPNVMEAIETVQDEEMLRQIRMQ